MRDKISHIITFLVFILVVSSFSKSIEKDGDFNVIRKIEISNDLEICNILDDVMSEKTSKESSDRVFYVIDLIDYEIGTIIGVHLIQKNSFLKRDNCIGYDQYNGHTVIVNGDKSHSDSFYVESSDVLKIKEHSKVPTPDGTKGWTFLVKDDKVYRYFMGMGWMLLKHTKSKKHNYDNHTLVLPKRKYRNINDD